MYTQDIHICTPMCTLRVHMLTPHVYTQGTDVCTSMSTQNKHTQYRYLYIHKGTRVGHTPEQT